MKQLEPSFTSKGWHFTEIRRRGDWAVFKKTLGAIVSFEVVKPNVQTQRYNFATKQAEPCEPHETYPASESWGTKGFTAMTEAQAFEKIEALTA